MNCNRTSWLTLLICFVICATGIPASLAVTHVGDIAVSQQSMTSYQVYHGYIEHPVLLRNTSATDSHMVTLLYPSTSYSRSRNSITSIKRTLVLAPNSSATVSLLQPPLPISGSSSSVKITVDNKEEKNAPIGTPPNCETAYYRSALNILISRTINSDDMDKQLNDQIYHFDDSKKSYSNVKPFHLIRAETMPSGWSDNWLGYTHYDGIVLRNNEINSMPDSVRDALWRYVETGGSLLVVGDYDPRKHHASAIPASPGALDNYNICFGHCMVCREADQSKWPKKQLQNMDKSWKLTRTPWESLKNMISAHKLFPVVNNIDMPLRTMFVLILLFAIAIGPVNFIILARRNRRIWLFWTVPAFSLLTSITVFVYSLLSDGITADIRMNALTILDQSTHRAVTLGLQGYYSPLVPRNGLQFNYGTEVTPLLERSHSNGSAKSVDWSRNQHFTDGWIQARIPAYFRIRKSELRRERLDLSMNGENLRVLNGLGVDIERLWLADSGGDVYTADNIAAGKDVTLTRTKLSVGKDDPFRKIYSMSNWDNLSEQLTTSPERSLRPGTYIVELKSCPFMENGLNKGNENFYSVVFGVL